MLTSECAAGNLLGIPLVIEGGLWPQPTVRAESLLQQLDSTAYDRGYGVFSKSFHMVAKLLILQRPSCGNVMKVLGWRIE
jgi:hypothetical protein